LHYTLPDRKRYGAGDVFWILLQMDAYMALTSGKNVGVPRVTLRFIAYQVVIEEDRDELFKAPLKLALT